MIETFKTLLAIDFIGGLFISLPFVAMIVKNSIDVHARNRRG